MHAGHMIPVSFPASYISVFTGNSSDVLTIFLDSILTKYFRKRDVNGC